MPWSLSPISGSTSNIHEQMKLLLCSILAEKHLDAFTNTVSQECKLYYFLDSLTTAVQLFLKVAPPTTKDN